MWKDKDVVMVWEEEEVVVVVVWEEISIVEHVATNVTYVYGF